MYSKIYRQIYEGTLAVGAPEALTVFMHMLVMGYPDGIVDVHPGILAQRTRLPLDFVMAGIAALEQPDPSSRSPLEDGRRIVRLDEHRDWGWQIVNFKHYRDLQNEQAKREYNRKWMARNRMGQSPHEDGNQPTVDQCGDSKSKSKSKETPLAQPDGFAKFWHAYPRKKSKGNAMKAWTKLNPDLILQSTILVAVQRAIKSPDWLKDNGQFIPYPASWLNARGWEDEITRPANGRIPE